MRYMGGKFMARKAISSIVLSHGLPVLEPFVGGANLPDLWPLGSVAYDTREGLIDLYQRVRTEGVDWLPDEVSESTYREHAAAYRAGKRQSGLDAFVLVGCAFSGKYGDGYARDDRQRNYCKNAKNSLRRLVGAPCVYECRDFFDIEVRPGFALYLDPPYRGTTGYDGEFSYAKFVTRAREWAAVGPVYVSEYEQLGETWEQVTMTNTSGLGMRASATKYARNQSLLFRVHASMDARKAG